jgi:hypothetical protein
MAQNNPIMKDIQGLNRYNTGLGGTSVNRTSNAIPKPVQPKQTNQSGNFWQAAQSFLRGFGRK